MGLSSVLPFLAAIQKQVIPPDVAGNPMVGGANAASLPNAGDAIPAPAPDLSVGQPQTPPPDPVSDLAQSMVQGQGAPKFHETKGHALMRILQAGVQGGLAGMAQNAQTYAQTGRNAGFGGGYQGAFQLPFMQQYQRNQLAQQQAQTKMLEAQSQMVQTPYGSMPAAFAKMLFPALARAGATTEAASTRAEATTQAAQTNANARIQAAKMGLGPIADVPEDLQQQFGLPAQLPLKMLNQAESAANKPLTVVAGANDSYVVNKQTQDKKPLGVGSGRIAATLARPVQVADPNNPGNITYESAGQAMKTGAMAPSSAPTQAAKAVTKSAVAGKIGDEINAFNTAMAHADLLKQAFTDLNNRNVRALNSLKNKWETEMGSPLPTNVQAISNAYSREITKMLSSGHMTDSEIGSSGATLPQNASPDQIMGALNAYQSLAQSKMQQRQNQVERGQKGQANFPQQQHIIQIGNQRYQYKGNGATDDLRNYDPI